MKTQSILTRDPAAKAPSFIRHLPGTKRNRILKGAGRSQRARRMARGAAHEPLSSAPTLAQLSCALPDHSYLLNLSVPRAHSRASHFGSPARVERRGATLYNASPFDPREGRMRTSRPRRQLQRLYARRAAFPSARPDAPIRSFNSEPEEAYNYAAVPRRSSHEDAVR